MASKALPCPTLLRQLLRYEPETGKLFWKRRPDWMFADGGRGGQATQAKRWNTWRAGQEAFTSTHDGYKRGHILRAFVGAHVVIWAIQTGAWPMNIVDHKDGYRANNKWGNLREATHAQNMQNTSSKGGTSQFLGVFRDKRSGKWRARIHVNSRAVNLGLFTDERDAAMAYDRAAVSAFGDFANPNLGR